MSHRLLSKELGYVQDIFEIDFHFSKEFQKAIHENFPDFVVNFEHIANEQSE
jgi:dihydroorotase